MREELIIKILDQSSEFLSPEQVQQLRNVINTELYNYEVSPAVHSLVPVNKSPEMLKLYLASKKLDGLAKGTLENYRRYLAKFLFCMQKEVENITAMDCRVFLANYSNTGIKNTTLNTISTTLKSFFGWLTDNDYIAKNPMNVIKTIKTNKYIRKALSFEEFELLRDSCKTIRDKAIIEFFYSTGARLDEVQKLNKTDIDWSTNSLMVFGKGSKERQVLLNPAAILHLKKYLFSRQDNNEALFIGERAPHERLGRRAIQRVFNKLGKKAGINKSVYPHLLRHTKATHMLKKGTDITVLQKILGHTSPSTTQIYAQTDNESMMEAHRKYA